jgi:hypothetical protein
MFSAFVVVVPERRTLVDETELAPLRYPIVVPAAPPEYVIVYILQAVVGVVAEFTIFTPSLIRNAAVELDGTCTCSAADTTSEPYENATRCVTRAEIFDQNETVRAAAPVTRVITLVAVRYDEPSRDKTVPYVASELVVGLPVLVSGYDPVTSVPIELSLNR